MTADQIYRLTNKVIDLEVASSTPSPTIDPSVRTILIGHSMGGIVAAETVLSIIHEQPLPPLSSRTSTKQSYNDAPSSPFMFPSILGVLAFDTPYLGLSPGVIAHGAESHFQTVKGAWSAYNTVSSAFGLGGATSSATATPKTSARALPPPSASDPDVAAAPAWQKWSRFAMYAGAAGALVAGGAAAYAKRAEISEGWSWATSHLAFVGCLARGAELEGRVNGITELADKGGFGFKCLFTQLGSGAGTLVWSDESAESGGTGSGEKKGERAGESGSEKTGDSWAHALAGSQRTFCLLPKQGSPKRAFFTATINDKAGSEIAAHMGMFTPKDNPGYYAMSEAAKTTVAEWVTSSWFVDDADSHENEKQRPSGSVLYERPREESPREETPELMDMDEVARDETPEIIKREDVEQNVWE